MGTVCTANSLQSTQLEPHSDESSLACVTRSYTEKLTAFYQQYNPQKLCEVDQLLERYAGSEDDLFAALTKKYGECEGARFMPDLLQEAFRSAHAAALAATETPPGSYEYQGTTYEFEDGTWKGPRGSALAECGCTLAAAVSVHPESGENVLWTAHCGDSYVLLCTDDAARGTYKGKLLTPPHNVANESESQRLSAAAGARVEGQRVVLSDGGPYDGLQSLAVTRALGHKHMSAERCGVLPVPDINRRTLSANHCAVIVCSDGVSDGIPKAGEQARAALDGAAAGGAKAAAEALVSAAMVTAPQPCDNTTAAVILLPV
eukprot:TRINITY_DN17281_c0_g1_i1.p1 TRINITY_DN17281_c0_g1~~TRINITY_DN17281_c0_g1_i1.p1  ORF type:complete len:318 (+),score=47.06 TRINITY_DN17281_c0_g1_i1:185-1138(+)